MLLSHCHITCFGRHSCTCPPIDRQAANATQHTLPSPRAAGHHSMTTCSCALTVNTSISGLVAEYIVAIDVTRARFPADAHSHSWRCLAALPPLLWHRLRAAALLRMRQDYRHSDAPEPLPRHMLRLAQLHMSTDSPVAGRRHPAHTAITTRGGASQHDGLLARASNEQEHQWSSGRIHCCHRCDPGSIPG